MKNKTGSYHSWRAMMTRCYYKSSHKYPSYGGRGISVCQRWHVYENFLADMGERPLNLTLDRRDNNGNYEPGNCRWATQIVQNRNRRDNRKIQFAGENISQTEWAERTGIPLGTIRHRLKKGWSIERALTEGARQ